MANVLDCDIIDGTLIGTTTPVRGDLKVMVIKGVLHILETPKQESHHWVQFNVIPRTREYIKVKFWECNIVHYFGPMSFSAIEFDDE